MNYLLSFVVLCFLLSGCSALGVQVVKSDADHSLKAAQTAPHIKERGPTRIPNTVSARIAASNATPKLVRDSFSGPADPDQF
jgi:hypothetical protein